MVKKFFTREELDKLEEIFKQVRIKSESSKLEELF